MVVQNMLIWGYQLGADYSPLLLKSQYSLEILSLETIGDHEQFFIEIVKIF